LLSFLEDPKSFLKKVDIVRKRMIWQELDDKKKHHLVNVGDLPRDYGGLGVIDLETMNKVCYAKCFGNWRSLKGHGNSC
jgi:hypothetical protein